MRVETVYIPETSKIGNTRGVLCVSSQVGCSLDCSFCLTGVSAGSQRTTHCAMQGPPCKLLGTAAGAISAA